MRNRKQENQDYSAPCNKSPATKTRGPRLSAQSSNGVKEARKGDNPTVDLASMEVIGCNS